MCYLLERGLDHREAKRKIEAQRSCYPRSEGHQDHRKEDIMSDERDRATVHAVGDGFFIGITPSGHAQVLDTNGTRRAAASPMELLLIALGACTAVDVAEILRKKRERVSSYRVEIRGTRRDEHPRHYVRMEVRHFVRGRNVSPRSVEQAIQLSEEKYCSVAATLRPTVEIVSTYEIEEETSAET